MGVFVQIHVKFNTQLRIQLTRIQFVKKNMVKTISLTIFASNKKRKHYGNSHYHHFCFRIPSHHFGA